MNKDPLRIKLYIQFSKIFLGDYIYIYFDCIHPFLFKKRLSYSRCPGSWLLGSFCALVQGVSEP